MALGAQIFIFLSARHCQCPLCWTPVIGYPGCSPHRRARRFLGSRRLKVAEVLFHFHFTCPYGHEQVGFPPAIEEADRACQKRCAGTSRRNVRKHHKHLMQQSGRGIVSPTFSLANPHASPACLFSTATSCPPPTWRNRWFPCSRSSRMFRNGGTCCGRGIAVRSRSSLGASGRWPTRSRCSMPRCFWL